MRRRTAALAVLVLFSAGCAARVLPPREADSGQFLFRAEVRGEEGEANLRLVLRAAGERRYQLGAADLVGRTMWSFAVAGDRFLWVDHRRKNYCRGEAGGAVILPLLRLELSPAAAPQILLGRLPVRIPEGAIREDRGQVRFTDGSGRRWTATLDPAGLPREWEMREPGGSPLASWQRDGSEFQLILPRRGLALRWRQASSEPLPGNWLPFSVPIGFEEVGCDVASFQ